MTSGYNSEAMGSPLPSESGMSVDGRSMASSDDGSHRNGPNFCMHDFLINPSYWNCLLADGSSVASISGRSRHNSRSKYVQWYWSTHCTEIIHLAELPLKTIQELLLNTENRLRHAEALLQEERDAYQELRSRYYGLLDRHDNLVQKLTQHALQHLIPSNQGS